MTDLANSIQAASEIRSPKSPQIAKADDQARSEIGIKFEKMLWAEMLRHTGLEKAVTKSGGQGASAFAQFMVEAIAEDIARRNPLGFEPAARGAEVTLSQDVAKDFGDAE